MKQHCDHCIGIEANLRIVRTLLNLSAGIGASILSGGGAIRNRRFPQFFGTRPKQIKKTGSSGVFDKGNSPVQRYNLRS